MTRLVLMAVAALLAGTALAQPQAERTGAARQKAWQVANFRTGLGDCSVLRDGTGFSLSAAASLSFPDRDSDDDGYDFSVTDGGAAVPVVAAHAINTKGTGAQNGRAAGQACGLAPSPRGSIPAGRSGAVAGITGGAVAGIVVAACSVSGDPAAPIVRFTIPLSSLGDAAKTYVAHVTLIRREASAPSVSEFQATRGDDASPARGEMAAARQGASGSIAMKVVATCDASALAAGRGAMRAGYDLAVGKKV